MTNTNPSDNYELPPRTPKIKGFSTSRNSKQNPCFTPKKMLFGENCYGTPLTERTYLKFSKFEDNVKFSYYNLMIFASFNKFNWLINVICVSLIIIN